MLLETLKEFDWMNEPQRVRFDEEGMHVAAKYRTDFWCCARYDFKKDVESCQEQLGHPCDVRGRSQDGA